MSLDITVIINNLQEIINILHEKMLQTINLCWFHKDASKKNNSLDDHSCPLYLISHKISSIGFSTEFKYFKIFLIIL